MTEVPPLEAAHPPAEEGDHKTPEFIHYPALGVFLILVMALLTYGGLLLLVVDDWPF
jgi:hypothetical protein